jgi:hypothetical protein
MFNLPSVAELYIGSLQMVQPCVGLIDYKKKKAQAQSQANFDENKFNEQYCKNNNINPKELNQLENVSKKLFSNCSQGLGIYELINMDSSLNNYASAQKKFKKTINYFDSNLESLISSDNANFENTIGKIKEIITDSKKALKDYIEKFKKDYDNLTIKDFKGKNVSDELALQRYAIHLKNTFSKSTQAKDENVKSANNIKKGLKSTKKKIITHEQRKIKMNTKISNKLYDSNHSISQVDEILGKEYVNLKNWNENLTVSFLNVFQNMITTVTA